MSEHYLLLCCCVSLFNFFFLQRNAEKGRWRAVEVGSCKYSSKLALCILTGSVERLQCAWVWGGWRV